jgi:Flp pilus assembly protein TadD
MFRLLSLMILAFATMMPPAIHAMSSSDSPPAAVRIDPDYAAGKEAVEKKDWPHAIESLNKAAAKDARNADIQNYLGYSYRNSGQMDLAFKHYEQALSINPKHRGAHEYVGEAYLMVNNLPKAEEHLAALDRLCTFRCQEYTELKEKIAAYKSKAK